MHIIFICIEAILMGAPYAIPAIPAMLGAVMFWAGIAGIFLYPLWIILRRTNFGAGLIQKRMSLTEGARLIYQKASPKLREVIRSHADASDTNPVESWGRSAFQICGSAGLVRLLGKRGPGLPFETIPSNELEYLWARDDDTIGGIGGMPPNYIEVVVSRADVLRVVAHYESVT